MPTAESIRLGYSPCPNDTFIFYGIAAGGLQLPGVRIEVELHYVETLNRMAMTARLDVTKLSFHAWLLVRERYRLLASGAALGYGCGPILVSKEPLTRSGVAAARIVLPGEWTTAHLLFRLWAPEALCADHGRGTADPSGEGRRPTEAPCRREPADPERRRRRTRPGLPRCDARMEA